MNVKTILENLGYKIFIKHERFYQHVGPITRNKAEILGINHSTVCPHGGKTTVDIYFDNHLIGHGVAECSHKDGFNRKVGREIALQRALENNVMQTMTVDWDAILEEVGTTTLANFCDGNLSRRELESRGSYTRKVVRALGANEVRTRARKALRRRNALSIR